MLSYLMLLGSRSLSESLLTRKMDYTGNSISNKISIYLKEFQECYREYFKAVFPLWFAAKDVQAGESWGCLYHADGFVRQGNFRVTDRHKKSSYHTLRKKKPLCGMLALKFSCYINSHCYIYTKELPDEM